MHYITSYNKAWHASFQCYMSDLSNSIAISASISFHAMSSLLVNNETKLNEERMTGTKIKNISSVYWDFFYQLIKLIKKKNPFLPPRIENLKVPPWKKNFKDGLIAHGWTPFSSFFFFEKLTSENQLTPFSESSKTVIYQTGVVFFLHFVIWICTRYFKIEHSFNWRKSMSWFLHSRSLCPLLACLSVDTILSTHGHEMYCKK